MTSAQTHADPAVAENGRPAAYLVLIVANAIYGTSYVASRVVLQDVGPATLALVRLGIGALLLVPLALARRPAGDRLSRGDHWKVFWMGLLGFEIGRASCRERV